MKRSDFYFIVFVLILFLPFILNEQIYNWYVSFNRDHGLIMSFLKFAILATMGEMIGLRIKSGAYNKPGFGVLPRAIVWGILGITIKMAFVIFTAGAIDLLHFLGMNDSLSAYKGDFSVHKVLVAFTISVLMNTIYAPIMMTTHKITDTHIQDTGGRLAGFFTPVKVVEILKNLRWDIQWNFVFKKTIPFFWYPAHTITFLLPADFQVLFAALLGIALGLILAIASLKSR